MGEIYGSRSRDSGGDGYRPPSAKDGYRPPSSYDGYRPPGDTSARTAGQDKVPTPDESRAAARGPDEEWEEDFGAESDAAIEARLDEAGLPTRAEARAAAWGPDATNDSDEDDEDDLDLEAATAIEARLDEAGLPTRAEARAAARGDRPIYHEKADLGEEDEASSVDASQPDLDQARALTLTADVGDAAVLGGHPYPDADNLVDESGDHWRERTAELEARNTYLCHGMTDVRSRPMAPRDDSFRDANEQQRIFGHELAKSYERRVDQQIDRTADAVNPNYDRTSSAYSENCTGVVQAYELRRRGQDVQAGPLETHLRKDTGGPGGRDLEVIEKTWGGKFSPGDKPQIEEAFKQPGSRGVVYIQWHVGGAHVFNVENNSGRVRFVDGQPTPARYEVSHYFSKGYDTRYLRLDDRPDPPEEVTGQYMEG